jgi:hypothetical protein
MSYRDKFNMHSPVRVSNSDPPLYKVVAERAGDDTFVLCVAHQQFRLFTLDTMPEDLKFIFAIIHVFDWDTWLNNANLPLPEQLKDIGWMCGRGDYMLILPEKLLEELRGTKRIN